MTRDFKISSVSLKNSVMCFKLFTNSMFSVKG